MLPIWKFYAYLLPIDWPGYHESEQDQMGHYTEITFNYIAAFINKIGVLSSIKPCSPS
jgi:hypothetical protein